MARTVTTGGAISGYWAIGSTRIAARPAITMKIESTAAKIGRSMKKREIMVVPDFYRWGWTTRVSARPCSLLGVRRRRLGGTVGSLLLRRRGCALAIGRRRTVGDLYRHAGRHQRELNHAFHDDAVAGLDTR